VTLRLNITQKLYLRQKKKKNYRIFKSLWFLIEKIYYLTLGQSILSTPVWLYLGIACTGCLKFFFLYQRTPGPRFLNRVWFYQENLRHQLQAEKSEIKLLTANTHELYFKTSFQSQQKQQTVLKYNLATMKLPTTSPQ